MQCYDRTSHALRTHITAIELLSVMKQFLQALLQLVQEVLACGNGLPIERLGWVLSSLPVPPGWGLSTLQHGAPPQLSWQVTHDTRWSDGRSLTTPPPPQL